MPKNAFDVLMGKKKVRAAVVKPWKSREDKAVKKLTHVVSFNILAHHGRVDSKPLLMAAVRERFAERRHTAGVLGKAGLPVELRKRITNMAVPVCISALTRRFARTQSVDRALCSCEECKLVLRQAGRLRQLNLFELWDLLGIRWDCRDELDLTRYGALSRQKEKGQELVCGVLDRLDKLC